MKEKEFEYIANKICDVLDNIEDKELHKKINSAIFLIFQSTTQFRF